MILRVSFLLLLALLLVACGGTETPATAPVETPKPPTAVADSVLPEVEDRDSIPDDATPEDDTPTADATPGDDVDDTSEDDLEPTDNNSGTESAGRRSKRQSPPKAIKGLADIPANRNQSDTPDPAPNEFVTVNFEAAPLNAPAVTAYINSLNKGGQKGKVYLKVLVGSDGFYLRHTVRQSPNEQLTNHLVQGLKRMKWSPATNSGEPVKVWVAYSHSFE